MVSGENMKGSRDKDAYFDADRIHTVRKYLLLGKTKYLEVDSMDIGNTYPIGF